MTYTGPERAMPTTARIPEPVARQIVALCAALSSLVAKMDRLDRALGEVQSGISSTDA